MLPTDIPVPTGRPELPAGQREWGTLEFVGYLMFLAGLGLNLASAALGGTAMAAGILAFLVGRLRVRR